jgi:hypothetical protein
MIPLLSEVIANRRGTSFPFYITVEEPKKERKAKELRSENKPIRSL